MTRYHVKEEGSEVSIELTEVGEQKEKLLGAFADCQAGQCSCPTDEYRKLAEMKIEHDGDAVRMRLEPKRGERFDLSEIRACLDHTTAGPTEEQAVEQV